MRARAAILSILVLGTSMTGFSQTPDPIAEFKNKVEVYDSVDYSFESVIEIVEIVSISPCTVDAVDCEVYSIVNDVSLIYSSFDKIEADWTPPVPKTNKGAIELKSKLPVYEPKPLRKSIQSDIESYRNARDGLTSVSLS